MRRMREAGMSARLDAVGNVVGTCPGRRPGGRRLILGSHLDTVRNAGKYDGALGVMLPIACLRALHAREERLDEIAKRIRNGNTDDWRQYWNVDSHGHPQAPRPEDVCRDALLSDLQRCLPVGIDAQPEGQYANDKRADMRIAFGGFQVPVELKKSSHPDLWRALREQLIAKYVRDPATGGCGIYLVFWFGDSDGHRTTRSPTGSRPGGPPELKQCLEATLPEAEARKISIRIIDVSAPRISGADDSGRVEMIARRAGVEW